MAVLIEPEPRIEPPAQWQRLRGPRRAGRGQAPVEPGGGIDREVADARRGVHALGEGPRALLVEMRDQDLLGAREGEDAGLGIVRVYGGDARRLEPARDGEHG